MTAYLQALGVALFAFAMRGAMRVIGDPGVLRSRFPLAGEQGDAMTHLLFAALIRRNGRRVPQSVPQFLLGPDVDYPPLFHWILALMPRRALERFEWLVSPVLEGLQAAFLFAATHYLASRYLEIERPEVLAMMVAVAFALTPLLHTASHRGSVLSARPFGNLAGVVALFATVVFSVSGEWGWAAAAVVSGAAVIVGSKFALQALVFIDAGLSIALLDVRPIAVLAATLAVAVVVSKGHVLRVISGSIRLSRVYYRQMVNIYDYTSSFSSRMIVDAMTEAFRGHPVKAWRLARKHPAAHVLLRNPWIISFVWLSATVAIHDGDKGAMLQALIAWSWVSIVICALTYLDSLKFLGEAERYLDFGFLPVVLVSLMEAGAQGAWLFLGMMVCSVVYIVGNHRRLIVKPTANPDAVEVVRKLAELPPSVIIPVPGRLAYPIVYETKHAVTWMFINYAVDETLRKKFVSVFRGVKYPYIHPDAFSFLQSDFGAELLVLDKMVGDYVSKEWGIEYRIETLPTVFENKRYVIKRLAVG